MKTLVSFVFDLVGWISAFLDALFSIVTRGNTDLTAGLVIATCLLVIIGCHDTLVRKRGCVRCACMIVVPLLVTLLLSGLACRLGANVTRLKSSQIQARDGHAFRYPLPQDMVAALADSNWWLISSDARMTSRRWILADSELEKTKSISTVEKEGRGLYRLSGRYLWFSTRDGGDPRSGERVFRLVREPAWLSMVRLCLVALYMAGATLFAALRSGRLLFNAAGSLFRDRLLVVPVCGFILFFGLHQMRFISQDGRMQMVTSRDDDGYMQERLKNAAESKTMDPLALKNTAYGAIGFYPYALLPCIAGHLGMTPSVNLLNVYVRGIKLLISVGMLVAVWLLGARHFGRVPAMVAVLLLATNVGFLSYSSYPFYPDVFMAMFSTLSLSFLLDLTARWDARSFFLAVAFAAMSVSIKFLTFLLFPFILVVGAAALWREHQGRRGDLVRVATKIGIVTAVLGVAVFFLCNPYLDYNIKWIVPNYKVVGKHYSAETSQIVAGAGATWSTWMDLGYRHGRDATDLVLACVAAGAVLASWLGLVIASGASGRIAPRSDTDRIHRAALLLLFAIVVQIYLVRSVTLASGIDQRLLLPLYPIAYLLAAWGVTQVFAAQISRPHADVRSRWTRKAMLGLVIVAGSLLLLRPRLINATDFFRHFGRQPEISEVSAWLSAVEAPPDARLVTSLQSYFPASYQNLIDGLWDPKVLLNVFYQIGTVPAAYIEDESYFDQFFSDAVKARGFNTTHQQSLFEEGSTFYRELRHNRVVPFVLAHQGREVVATNLLGQATSNFRVYVNPYAFSENIADRAVLTVSDSAGEHVVDRLPTSVAGGLALRWAMPATVAVVHLSLRRSNASDLRLRLEDGNGRTETLPLLIPNVAISASTERFVQLDPPREIQAMFPVSADGTPCRGDAIRSLRVHPPVPVGLNPTRHFFEIGGVAGEQTALDALIAFRPRSQTGVEVRPGQPVEFSLTSRINSDTESAWVVLDAAPPGACIARCVYVFKDQSRHQMDGVEQRTTEPDAVFFRWDNPSDKAVRRIEFSIVSQAPDGKSVTLRQVHVKANPTAEEAAQ